MKKILIGMIMDGKAGGVDRYILDFHKDIHGIYANVDFLTSNYDKNLAEELKKSGSELLECPKMTDLLGQYRALKKIVSENKYDIVYFNYSTAIGWTAVKGAHDAGAKKVIVHSHNSGFSRDNILIQIIYKLIHYLFRPLLCRYATDYLSCSDKAAHWMFGSKSKNENSVKYIKNEVNTEIYCFSEQKREYFRSEFGLEDSFVIGQVGGMLKAKNQAFLIKIMPKLKKYIPNAKLLLVGDGEKRRSLQILTKKLNLNDDVIFAGYMNTTNGVMNAFDVFCLPSYIEGLPYVALEAQILRIPCILSDKITKQVAQTSACAYISINKPKQWINKIVKYQDMDRCKIQGLKNQDDKFITRVEFIEDMLKKF